MCHDGYHLFGCVGHAILPFIESTLCIETFPGVVCLTLVDIFSILLIQQPIEAITTTDQRLHHQLFDGAFANSKLYRDIAVTHSIEFVHDKYLTLPIRQLADSFLKYQHTLAVVRFMFRRRAILCHIGHDVAGHVPFSRRGTTNTIFRQIIRKAIEIGTGITDYRIGRNFLEFQVCILKNVIDIRTASEPSCQMPGEITVAGQKYMQDNFFVAVRHAG